MEIWDLREEDLPAIVDMVFAHRKSRVPGLSVKVKDEVTDILWKNLGAPLTHTFVATEYGEVYGLINFHFIECPMIVGKECYVSDLLVNEKQRGKGVGSKLLEEAERFAKEKGCTRMMLNNGKFTVSYQGGFHSKRGYKERKNMANFVKSL